MKQKFTSEKNKYLENKNKSENKTMFNFKISCLMKQSLFKLMMTLAIVFGLSASAWAQGLYVSDVYEVPMGATVTFSVNDNTTNSSYDWDVFELADDHTEGAADPGTSVVGDGSDVSHKVSLTSTSSYTTDATFFGQQAANTVFVVQVTETETATGTCSTIRRFYVSVFDYDVQVVALGNVNSAPTDWNATFSPWADCNTWSGNVVQNTFDATAAGSAYAFADSIDNDTDGNPKYTDTYIAVRIHSTVANLDEYRSRIQWSFSTATALEIYSIEAIDATATGPKFSGESGSVNWVAANENSSITEPTAYVGDTYDTQQTMYFPKAGSAVNEIVKIFRVRTHNLLGAADMVYNFKVDRIQLEKDDTGGAYNNGQKFHTSTLATTDGLARLDGQEDTSESTTIRQSPATEIINVSD